MSDFLPLEPTNRKLWDDSTRHTLALWWVWGIMLLIFGWQMVDLLTDDLPQVVQDKVAHDAFVAASEITEASIINCTEYLLGTTIAFDFIPNGSTIPIRGHSFRADRCANYADGKIQIRYLPSNPSQHERVSKSSHEDRMLVMTITIIPLGLINVLIFGYNCIFGLLLAAKGRVRIGRIVSAKPRRILLGQCWVRYTVTADDGTVLKGWRVLNPLNTLPTLIAGAPIPVLYANKWIHWAFVLSVRG